MTGQLEIICQKILFLTLVGNEMYTRLDTLSYMMPFDPYYPVVPAFVGTTSNSDMTGFEASGGCRGKGG